MTVVLIQFGSLTVSTRAWLEDFYQKHNPEMIPKIDYVLNKYSGMENELILKVTNKYIHGVE